MWISLGYVIGGLLTFGGGIGLIKSLSVVGSIGTDSFQSVVAVAQILLFILNLMAGFSLLAGKARGVSLAFFSLFLQLFCIQTPGISWCFNNLFGVYLGYSAVGENLSFVQGTFVELTFGYYTTLSQVKIDLFALLLIFILYKVNNTPQVKTSL